MVTTHRQAVGIDISADSFVAAICSIDTEQDLSFLSIKTFSNTSSGFTSLIKWTARFLKESIPVVYAMEATGVYFEKLAYILKSHQLTVSVLLPNKVSHFARTLDVKSKNDLIDAKVIAQLAVERKLKEWHPTSVELRNIKQLLREHNELIKEKTQINNQLHSKKAAFEYCKSSINRSRKRIKFITQQIEDLLIEIDDLLTSNESLSEQVKLITSIKGVGQLTALTVLCETDGFGLIENGKQLVSFAGYDVVEKQSGTSLNGRKKISKKGNKHIRKALHYPALSAVRHDKNLASFYQKINERKNSKMVGLVAVQRKILLLIYAINKSGIPYNPNFTSVDKETKSSFLIDSKNQKESRAKLITLH